MLRNIYHQRHLSGPVSYRDFRETGPRLEPVARVSNLTFQGEEDLVVTIIEMMQLKKLRCYFLRWTKRRLRLKTVGTLELSFYDWERSEDRVRLAIPLSVPLLFLVWGYDTASPQMTEPQTFSRSFDPDCKVWYGRSKPLPARLLTILSFWIIQVFWYKHMFHSTQICTSGTGRNVYDWAIARRQ